MKHWMGESLARVRRDSLVGFKSVCFISETGRHERPILDGSVRYRCYHLASELKELGYLVGVCSATEFYNAPHTDYDVYVFHRPNAARTNFAKTLNLLRRSGRTLIADYDDLIFGDAHVALESSAAKNGTQTIPKILKAFAFNLEALAQFDVVTTSTEPLSRWARQYHPGARVHVVPNVIPSWMVSLHAELGTPWRTRPASTIGYFAGTKSHDHDFPIVQEVLHRILSEDRHRQLLIVGPVAVPSGLASLPNVLSCNVVSYSRLPALMTKCSTVIAPLEESSFNECKSRVKFLEAALAGCHLVATPIPDMQELEGKGLSLARSADDWYQCLSKPVAGESLDAAKKAAFSSLSSRDSVAAFMTAVSGI
jgi:glycosyltransferase involved in cell wall biosynthesis